MSASEEAIEAYRELFTCLDLNKNGKLDADELDIGLRDHGMERRRESIIKMINNVDTDNDQELDFDDFLNLIQSEELESLFENEEEVDSLEEALGKLELTPMGYKHGYVRGKGQDLCEICFHKKELHYFD